VRVVKMRGQKIVGGYHDFDIVKGGARVYPRLVAAEHHAEFKQDENASSGAKGLDALLGGGAQRGTSTLVVGPAGSGKSSIAAMFAHAAAERGENVALFTFEETTGVFAARCRGLGIPFDKHFASGRVQCTQIDPAELAPAEFVHRVRSAVEDNNARLVVIDSLNGFMNAMPEERFLALQLHELLTYLSHHGVATFIVMTQHGLVGSNMSAPVDVSYVADNVIMLRYFEAGGRVRKALSVIKRRAGAHEATIRELHTRPGHIEIGEPLEAFHGVLTGVPVYAGATGGLIGGKQ
jgi:circadian clock protein KaiC